MVKIGDKVRFLNSTGGGQVKAFSGKNMALVEDESGFVLPVLISECVVIGEKDNKLRNSQPTQPEQAEKKDKTTDQKKKNNDSTLNAQRLTPLGVVSSLHHVQPKPVEIKPIIKETPEEIGRAHV